MLILYKREGSKLSKAQIVCSPSPHSYLYYTYGPKIQTEAWLEQELHLVYPGAFQSYAF